MNDMLLWVGRIAGVVGALLCAGAIVVRLGGVYWIAGYQVGTLLLAGTAAMIGGCLCLLWVLTARRAA